MYRTIRALEGDGIGVRIDGHDGDRGSDRGADPGARLLTRLRLVSEFRCGWLGDLRFPLGHLHGNSLVVTHDDLVAYVHLVEILYVGTDNDAHRTVRAAQRHFARARIDSLDRGGHLLILTLDNRLTLRPGAGGHRCENECRQSDNHLVHY